MKLKLSAQKILPVLGVVVPIILFTMSPFWNSLFDHQKRLEYRLMGESTIINNQDDPLSLPDIKIYFKNQELKNSKIIFLELSNSGGEPIKKEDFQTPLEIQFENSEVISFLKGWSSPKSIEIEGNTDGSRIFIDPLLMNPGDSFELKILITGDGGLKSIKSRIVGVKDIERKESELASGIHILKSDDSVPGRMSTITKISPITLAILVIPFLTLSISYFTLKNSNNNKIVNFAYIITSTITYFTAVALSILFIYSMPEKGNLNKMTAITFIVIASFILSKLILYLANSSKNNSEEIDNHT